MVKMGQTTDTVIAFYGIGRSCGEGGAGGGRVLNQNGEPVIVNQNKLMVKARG